MATRKHILLLLPALLAAMGSAQSSAFASDGIGLVADLAGAPDRLLIEPPVQPAAVAAQPPEIEAPADAISKPDADETLRRTIFEILAEARNRIGFLPDPAATSELVSGELNDAEQARATETPRRTIFDILADARGNPRFLTKESAPADGSANGPAVEPLAAAAPPPEAETLVVDPVGDTDQPIAAETPRSTIEVLAEARGNPRFLAKDAFPATSVANEPSGMTLETDSLPETEAETSDAHRPIAAEAPRGTIFDILAEAPDSPWFLVKDDLPGDLASQPSADLPVMAAGSLEAAAPPGEAPRQTVLDILAEARGNPRFLVSEASLPDSFANEFFAHDPTVVAETPEAGASTNSPPPPAATEAHRQTIFEVIAEARSRIGFLPERAGAAEHGRAEIVGSLRAATTDAPRQTIFDILAEARGNPRVLAKESAPADSLAKGPAVEPLVDAAVLSAPKAKAGDASVHPAAGQAPAVSVDASASSVRSVPVLAARSDPAPAPTLVATMEGEHRNPDATSTPSPDPAPAKPRSALLAAAEVDLEKLDTLRGGFETPGGLRVSFGIERAVVINGVLQSSTQMRVNDLGGTMAGGTNPANVVPAPGMATVVQNGVNNSTLANLPAAAMATVVQNSLNNQRLQTITTINATVNSAEMLRGVRMQQSLQDSLNRAALAR
jgi:hypothetical protein